MGCSFATTRADSPLVGVLRIRRARFLGFGVIVCAATGLLSSMASAHESHTVGDLTITFGWRDEPTFAGLPNAVMLTAVDGEGAPVDDPAARMTVTVSFGEASIVRPLLPIESPGSYAAEIVPTQPGTYSLQITGELAGETLDIASTCSDESFHCVADAGEVEFPSRVAGASAPSGADGSAGDAGSGSARATAALVLSTVAVIVAVGVGLRSRRSETPG